MGLRRPFDYPRIEYVREVRRSKQLNHMTEPAIVISASGMAESGRVLHHLKNNISHPENTVLFVSYQVQHTLGRRILEGNEKVRIFGEEYCVRAEVARINGYSAHADQAELLKWASHFDQERLQKIFLVHGEPEGACALAEELRGQGHSDVVMPTLHQSFEFCAATGSMAAGVVFRLRAAATASTPAAVFCQQPAKKRAPCRMPCFSVSSAPLKLESSSSMETEPL